MSQNLGQPIFFSLSQAIEDKKKDYYDALKSAQRKIDVTNWLHHFLKLCIQVQEHAEELINFTLKKVRYFDQYRAKLNPRQKKAALRIFEAGLDGFQDGMSTKKYVTITGTSVATATRDLQELRDMGAMTVTGGGRSTRYRLKIGFDKL